MSELCLVVHEQEGMSELQSTDSRSSIMQLDNHLSSSQAWSARLCLVSWFTRLSVKIYD